jgi:hypothetical protein
MALLSTNPVEATTVPETDALALLEAEHNTVADLLREFERATGKQRGPLGARICEELRVRARIAEEILYPAARRCLRREDQEILDQAYVEHTTIEHLISRLDESKLAPVVFDAFIRVLGEYVTRQMKDEETQLFPRLKRTDVDLIAMGSEIRTRRGELGNGVRRGRPSRQFPVAKSA